MRRLRRLLVRAGLLTVVLMALGGGWLYHQYRTPTENLQTQQVVVAAGANLHAVARELAARDIYPYPEFLYYWARLTGQTDIRAGEYAIAPDTELDDLLALLVSGRSVQYRVTFAEGLTFSAWRDILADRTRLEQELPDMTDQEVAARLGLQVSRPEGWLFPSTYFYHLGMSDLDIVRRAHQEMQKVLTAAWAKRSDQAPVDTPYATLILASIIERETGAAWERPDIAGVFARRLARGMRLQTDPTVIYGMGERYDGSLARRDLEAWTPYNTYQIDGLPPTPIAMPGRDAIIATLNPAPGSALYFVARGDGTHVFSDTLRDHNRAVHQYQLQRRDDYRSAPPAE